MIHSYSSPLNLGHKYMRDFFDGGHRKNILKGITGGFTEWYKDYLMQQTFGE